MNSNVQYIFAEYIFLKIILKKNKSQKAIISFFGFVFYYIYIYIYVIFFLIFLMLLAATLMSPLMIKD
jgi:hypothetical protein